MTLSLQFLKFKIYGAQSKITRHTRFQILTENKEFLKSDYKRHR